MMSKFYFELWFRWLIRVLLCTLFFASLFSSGITLLLYIKQGMQPLNKEVTEALYAIWHFWFLIFLNVTLLIALFRSTKYLFNRCYATHMLRLKSCEHKSGEVYIDPVGYGDLIKVWRKWFMLLIWIVAAFMILSVALTYLLSSYTTIFAWFSIYILYTFIAIAAYFSFVLLTSRCKAIRVVKCSSM